MVQTGWRRRCGTEKWLGRSWREALWVWVQFSLSALWLSSTGRFRVPSSLRNFSDCFCFSLHVRSKARATCERFWMEKHKGRWRFYEFACKRWLCWVHLSRVADKDFSSTLWRSGSAGLSAILAVDSQKQHGIFLNFSAAMPQLHFLKRFQVCWLYFDGLVCQAPFVWHLPTPVSQSTPLYGKPFM